MAREPELLLFLKYNNIKENIIIDTILMKGIWIFIQFYKIDTFTLEEGDKWGEVWLAEGRVAWLSVEELVDE